MPTLASPTPLAVVQGGKFPGVWDLNEISAMRAGHKTIVYHGTAVELQSKRRYLITVLYVCNCVW